MIMTTTMMMITTAHLRRMTLPGQRRHALRMMIIGIVKMVRKNLLTHQERVVTIMRLLPLRQEPRPLLDRALPTPIIVSHL